MPATDKAAIDMMQHAVLTLNAGSSSIKVGLFAVPERGDVTMLCKGLLDKHATSPRLTIRDAAGHVVFEKTDAADEQAMLADLLDWTADYLGAMPLLGVGHRIVHGGPHFVDPVRLSTEIIDDLAGLAAFAPLHQLHCLAPARMLLSLRPDLPQIGCFDTAFHSTIDATNTRLAIPEALAQRGLRRYGFHGLSYEYIARRLRETRPDLVGKRTVIAHLGSGASLCAIRDGTSIDTTMGLTPLDGLVMATRCGTIDPGLLICLQQADHMNAVDLEHLLYEQSGLLGLSSISGDMRTLLASEDPRARSAVDVFCIRAATQISAMAHSLGGLDCLLFTGGIGENSDAVRERICADLTWLGVDIDTVANRRHAECFATANTAVELLVLTTSEETTIARHCAALQNDSATT
jgi:acetate kinase